MIHCLNCDKSTNGGNFCAHCGQSKKIKRAPILSVVRESLSDFFAFDSKILHSLRPLIFSPGTLTKLYIAGKRERVISPVRLYVFTSFIFFFFARLSISDNDIGWDNSTPNEDAGISESDVLEIIQNGIQMLPHFLVLAIPLLALILHLMHRRPTTYFYDHLIFSLHIHTFLLIGLFVLSFIQFDFLSMIFLPAHFAYWLIAIKRCYGRSWKLSAAKASVLFLCDPVIILLLVAISFGKAANDAGV